MPRFLRSRRFWLAFCAGLAVAGSLSAWQLGLLSAWIPTPPRVPVTRGEELFTVILVLLLAMNAGLYAWRKAEDSCPIGARRATGLAGTLGLATLFCPACTVIPLAVLGTTFSLTFLTAFLPLLRVIALVLAGGALILLWPRDRP
jgi:hypothetical protein